MFFLLYLNNVYQAAVNLIAQISISEFINQPIAMNSCHGKASAMLTFFLLCYSRVFPFQIKGFRTEGIVHFAKLRQCGL